MNIICSCLSYFDTYITKTALDHTLVYAAEQSLQLLLRGMQLQVGVSKRNLRYIYLILQVLDVARFSYHIY